VTREVILTLSVLLGAALVARFVAGLLSRAAGSGYLGAFLAGLIVGNMEHLGLELHAGGVAGEAAGAAERSQNNCR